MGYLGSTRLMGKLIYGNHLIAEGVETEEQRFILLNKGCTHYQGYLFGKPIPIEEFEKLLKLG
jgi:EAL domain-containing protein (putative c-di-GMP-specific phosphodiesterase class I)